MAKKIRLTKKRLAALDAALSFDDILYEKFRRLNDDLQREAYRLIRRRYKMYSVIQKGKNGVYTSLMIIEINPTPDGFEIIVAEPK